MKILAWGMGYVARRLAQNCPHLKIVGTTRQPVKADKGITNELLMPFSGDIESGLRNYASQADVWLVSIPPVNGRDMVADLVLRERLALPSQVVYLSATSVYGGHDGGYRDELSLLDGEGERAEHRRTAEATWMHLCSSHSSRFATVRLSGIYGPQRNALHRVLNGQTFSLHRAGAVTSRIHVDDIVAGLKSIIGKSGGWGAFNMADDLPCSPAIVTDYACQLLGLPALPRKDPEDRDVSPSAKSFMQHNRRIYARRLRELFDWSPQFPTYKEGLQSCFVADMKQTLSQDK